MDWMGSVIEFLNNPLFEKVVVFVAGLLGIVKYLKNRAVQKWSEVAFRSVEEFARIDSEKGNKIKTDDKINLFCIKFREFMVRSGWWIVTETDVAQAKAIASALNLVYSKGQEVIEAGKELAKEPNPNQ